MLHNHSWADDDEPTDIWLVTSGEYSEYSVDAAFSTEEAANDWAYVQNANSGEFGSKFNVERVDLNPPLPAIVKKVIDADRADPIKEVTLPQAVKDRIERETADRVKLVESIVLE